MYWCKSAKSIILKTALCFALLASCKPEIRQNGSQHYFDLKKYFTDEANRLKTANPTILKSVTYNGEPEQKTIKIENWQHELALFIASDINKPAWRNSYKVVSNADSDIYTAIDTNLKTRYIAIKKAGGKVKEIRISNVITNLLYQNRENLTYYPDSVYLINKKQTVRILGENNYEIKGAIQHK